MMSVDAEEEGEREEGRGEKERDALTSNRSTEEEEERKSFMTITTRSDLGLVRRFFSARSLAKV